MNKKDIIGASTLAAFGNPIMTLWSNVLRGAVRWGCSAVGIACLVITTVATAGETWDTFASGAGVDGPVRAVTTFGGDLIVGGQFGTAGGAPDTFGIARWDGANWWALGSGTQNSVLALTTFNGELIAGGLFTSASGVPGTSHIAKWNGTTWSPLGAGLSDDVYALTTFNGALYAGGRFTKSGTTKVNYLAKWNGSAWSSVASGMNGNVRALTTFNNALYAGGEFTRAGNANGFNRLAKWNGSAWSTLGTGVDGNSSIVFALTTFNGGLIVGGQFAMAGGVAGTPGIARWSGSTWSALASGLNNTVMSLASFDDLSGSGTELYVGGYFTAPVGGAANSAVQIARWNGAWSAVGSGMVVTQPGDSMPRAVFALSPNPNGDLLCAGGFCEVDPHTVGVAGYLMGYQFVP
jgi:trimeric autotransporter adhesin